MLTIAGTALFTYNDSYWVDVCDAGDNFWDCTDCSTSGVGKASQKVWGCTNAGHPCSNYAWFRFEVHSSAYILHSGYVSKTCPAADLLNTCLLYTSPSPRDRG